MSEEQIIVIYDEKQRGNAIIQLLILKDSNLIKANFNKTGVQTAVKEKDLNI